MALLYFRQKDPDVGHRHQPRLEFQVSSIQDRVEPVRPSSERGNGELALAASGRANGSSRGQGGKGQGWGMNGTGK